MLYLLESSLSLAAFYLFYKLLCSRDTWHRQNRLLLLFIFALSAVIPFLYIDLGMAAREASVFIEELGTPFMVEAADLQSEPLASATPTLWQRIGQLPWRALFATLYFSGLAVCIVHFLVSLLAIVRLIRSSQCRPLPDGTILVTHTKSYGPFSWMRYIIVSEHDLSDNSDMILAHERAHIRLHHSWDLLFVQLCAMTQWFNPAAWLLKRELEAIHEYEADSDTLRQGFDARQYQLRLFEAVVGTNFNTITNNFNNCSTKKRIIMMMKKQSSPWTRMKALFVLPVAFVAVAVISCTSQNGNEVEVTETGVIITNNGKDKTLSIIVLSDGTEITPVGDLWADEHNKDNNGFVKFFNLRQENIEAVEVLQEEEAKAAYGESAANGAIKFHIKEKSKLEILNALRELAKSKGANEPLKVNIKYPFDASKGQTAEEQGEIFQVVEEQPIFPGGMEELMKYMQKEIQYPQEALDKGIGGRVVVQFVVNKDGSITDANVVKSIDPTLDAEALRAVNSMPNWTPGKQKGEPVRVRFTLPVAFGVSKGGDPASGTTHTYTKTTVVKNEAPTQEKTAEDEIYNVVEEIPIYLGGHEALMKYIQQNVRYPKEAQDKGIQGRVVVQFVVNKDGSISDAKVVKPVDPQLDAEALRVVNAMPNWTPGKDKGEPVRTRFTLPVSFRLAN